MILTYSKTGGPGGRRVEVKSAYPAHGCLTYVTVAEPDETRYIPLDRLESFSISEDSGTNRV